MRKVNLKRIAIFIVIVLVFNLIAFSIFGSTRVEAGFWDDRGGSFLTVIKGLVMLWVINLMINNSNDSNEDIITSTIKNGLNINDPREKVPEKEMHENIIDEDEYMELTKFENELVKLVNNKRKEYGLNYLEVDLKLVDIARVKARDMIENNYFDHESPTYGSPFTMIQNEGIKYSLAGENIASARTIDEAFTSLMESTEHRDNILKSRFDRIGVGVIKGGEQGLMIVQLFLDSPDPAK